MQELLKQYYERTKEKEGEVREGKVSCRLEEETEKSLLVIIEDISITGRSDAYLWQHLRHFIAVQMTLVLDHMHSKGSPIKTPVFNEHKEALLLYLYEFNELPPFTLQRLCELILKPELYYNSSNKLLYAFEKLVSVSQP